MHQYQDQDNPQPLEMIAPTSFSFTMPLVYLCIVLAITSLFFWQQTRISHYKELYNKELQSNKELQENNKTLKSAIEDQNKKISDAKLKSNEMEKMIADLTKELEQEEKKSAMKRNEMLKLPTPANSKEVIDYLDNIMKDIKWE